MSDKGLIFSGARAVFKLQNIEVGYAKSVQVSEEITYEAVEVLDNIRVQEHVATAYRVSFSASQFRIIGTTVKSQGWFPKVGNNTEDHLKNILVTGELTATVEDRKTGKSLATLTGVRIASHNWTVDARGIVGEDVSFVAICVKDETET